LTKKTEDTKGTCVDELSGILIGP